MFDCLSFSHFASTLTHTHTHFTCFLFSAIIIYCCFFFWRTHCHIARWNTFRFWFNVDQRVYIYKLQNYVQQTIFFDFFLALFTYLRRAPPAVSWHRLLNCSAYTDEARGMTIWQFQQTAGAVSARKHKNSCSNSMGMAKIVHCYVRMAHSQCDHELPTELPLARLLKVIETSWFVYCPLSVNNKHMNR